MDFLFFFVMIIPAMMLNVDKPPIIIIRRFATGLYLGLGLVKLSRSSLLAYVPFSHYHHLIITTLIMIIFIIIS